MKKPGKVSPNRVASLLGVHVHTVRAWCQKAVAGEPSRLQSVERNHVTGYYWIDLKEAIALKNDEK